MKPLSKSATYSLGKTNTYNIMCEMDKIEGYKDKMRKRKGGLCCMLGRCMFMYKNLHFAMCLQGDIA